MKYKFRTTILEDFALLNFVFETFKLKDKLNCI